MGKLSKEKIEFLYFKEKKSQKEIAEIFETKQSVVCRFMKKNFIQARSLKEAKQVSTKNAIGLVKWRKENSSFWKGKTKDDPQLAAIIEKGRQTQIKNGKNKGKNNPMYGKIVHGKNGYRKDLEHSVRSSWEANFARGLKVLELNYEYEKYTFELSDGTTYTPDFYIPSKNKFYEIKGYDYEAKYKKFQQEYPDKILVLVNEKFYNRFFSMVCDRIKIEDKNTFFTKEEIESLFIEFCKVNTKISILKFCKSIGISDKPILKIYGGRDPFKNKFEDLIKNLEIQKLIDQRNQFYNIYKYYPSRKELYKYYKRTDSVIRIYFNRRYSNFESYLNKLINSTSSSKI